MTIGLILNRADYRLHLNKIKLNVTAVKHGIL